MTAAMGLVLFGHGARDPRWADTMKALAARVRSLRPEVALELAFLEFMQPNLADAVAALVARGVRSIWVAPVFLAAGGHVLRDLPDQLAELSLLHDDLEIQIGTALGGAPPVIDAMAQVCLDALVRP
jgi:sirohydrochlorin cobaltochelatase